jgi:AraC-like DNA-binding protein
MNIWHDNWGFSCSEIVYKKGTIYGPRRQTALQLVYVLDGRADIRIDRAAPYRLRPNEATLLLPGHTETFQFAAGTRHSWCYAHCDHYPDPLLKQVAAAPKVIAFDPKMRQVEQLAREAYPQGADASGRCREQLVAVVFFMYLAAAGVELEKEPTPQHPAVAKADAYMKANRETNLSLDALADEAGLTPAHLIRLYKLHFGQTPMRRLMTLRLDLAASLLRETGLTAAEVADHAGFSNPQHFSKAFRRHFGKTPRQLRMEAWKRKSPCTNRL